MPGVPSGKGCDACRKQKKKCDLGKPSCARCTRLRIPCIGAGQQRYKFKDQSKTVKRMNSDSSSESHTQSSQSVTPDPAAIDEGRRDSRGPLSRTPSNELCNLASALVQVVRPETSCRWNIANAYGGFVTLIPQRLGRNPALDASVSAMLQAHSDFCNGQQQASRAVLGKYSQALTKLRVCLDDPKVATESETLCSVMLLLITQSFIGTGGSRPAASHVVGMANLLKVRGTHHDPNDRFESLLLLTLRGPVVFEGLWNDQIEFTEPQWRELVENHWDEDQRPEGIMMRCIAKLPIYILRGRKVLRGEALDPTLAQEVSVVYGQLASARQSLVKRIKANAEKIACAGPELRILTEIRDALWRIDSFYLAVIIIAGCVLGAVSAFTPQLQSHLNACAAEIYDYVPYTSKWRPLGSSYMLLSLSMAYTGTDDAELKAKLREAYVEQHRDFPAEQSKISVVGALDAGAEKFLRLGLEKVVRRDGVAELKVSRKAPFWVDAHVNG